VDLAVSWFFEVVRVHKLVGLFLFEAASVRLLPVAMFLSKQALDFQA
jgi:hypothetical protein